MIDILQEKLLRQKPYLSHYFTHSKEKSAFRLKKVYDDQEMIIYQKDDLKGRKIKLSSSLSPRAEASRILQSQKISITGKEVVLILGVTSPECLALIHDQLKNNQICIAIDYHFNLGQELILNSNKTLQFLQRPGSHLFCGSLMENTLWHYLHSIPIEHFHSIVTIKIPTALRLAPLYYLNIEHKLLRFFSLKLSDLLTRLKFQKVWLEHTLKNSSFLPIPKVEKSVNKSKKNVSNIYHLNHYLGALKKRAAVLVGSGPSLINELSVLEKLHSRAFILAVSSALPILQKKKIRVDAVITLDAQKHALFPFLENPESKEIIFADLVTPPSVFINRKNNPIIFYCSQRIEKTAAGQVYEIQTPGVSLLEKIHGRIGAITSGGSVATSGFDLLGKLGCDPIILIGHDLQYTHRQIHSPGFHQYNQWQLKLKRTQSLMTMTENIIQQRSHNKTSDSLSSHPQDFILDIYHQWFEDRLTGNSPQVYNFTTNGRKIKNCIHLRRNEQDSFIESLPPFRLAQTKLRESQKLGFPMQQCHSYLEDFIDKMANMSSNSIEVILDKYPFLQNLIQAKSIHLHKKQPNLSEKIRTELLHQELKKIMTDLALSLRKFISGVKRI